MKTLKDTISEELNESLKPNLKTLLDKLHYDFSETGNMSISSKNDRALKAKAQEKIFIDVFNNATDDYKAVSIEDYCKTKEMQYSHVVDSEFGDIIIMDGDNEAMFIDLKVANTNAYYGTPDMLSLVNFASKDDDKKYYLCCRIDGVDSKLVKANDLYKIVVDKKCNVIASSKRNIISPEVEKLTDKVNIVAPRGTKYDVTKLYDNDFVESGVIRRL